MRSLDEEPSYISSINVTPMVDITLVLLIIFMVTARFIAESGLKVDLPRAQTTEAGLKARLKVTFNEKGELYLAKKRMDEASLRTRLAREAQADPDVHVTLAADSRLPYGEIMRVLDLIKQAGVVKVGLASVQ